MRVALVTSAFRSRSPIDLASHIRILSPALARAGASVEVFAGTIGSGLVPYAQRRAEVVEPVDGRTFGVTTIELEESPDEDRVAEAFAAFLDRERPSVCHFEQLDPMGVGLVREAKRRKISTIYSAHDTWAAHDRTTLTLPDLTPFDLGDTEAEARSLAARRVMRAAGQSESGPFGYSPEEVQRRDRVRQLLHEELGAPADAAALRDARETVEVRRAQKRIALSGVDRRFAASRLLSRELSAAVGRAFTYRAPGVDQTVLASIVAPGSGDTAPSGYATVDFAAASTEGLESQSEGGERAPGPVRLVYMGTTDPTRGLDVLLDAIERLRGEEKSPTLAWRFALERSDDARDALIHERAEALGVDINWSRNASVDVRSVLAGADALVLPSLWGEVAPVEVRLALACAVPVIASRMPGVVEAAPSTASVLVTPGDAEALADTLKRLGSDEGAVALKSLRSAAQGEKEGATKSIDDEALEWLDTYASLVESVAALARARAKRAASGAGDEAHPAFGAPAGPPAVKKQAALLEVDEQIASLRALSNTELFARAQEGIVRLRKAFGLRDSEASLLARVVARGGAVRDRAEHDAATRREVARALEELRAAQSMMQAEESVRSRRIADLHSVLEQYEHEVQSRAEEASRAASLMEAAQAKAGEAVADAEAAMAEAQRAALEKEAAVAEVETLKESAQSLQQDVESLTLDLSSTAAERDALQVERDSVKASLSEVEAASADRERLESNAAELESRYREVAMQVESAKAALEDAENARAELARSVDQRALEIRSLRDRVVKRRGDTQETCEDSDHELAHGETGSRDVTADLESIEAYCVALERDLEALKRNDSWVAGEADRLIQSLAHSVDEGTERKEDGSPEGEDALALERTSASLERLTLELDWRRAEMDKARDAADSLRARFLAGPLASRIRAWSKPPVDVVSTMTALTDPKQETDAVGNRSETPEASESGERVAIKEANERAADQPEPEAPLPSSGSEESESGVESMENESSEEGAKS